MFKQFAVRLLQTTGKIPQKQAFLKSKKQDVRLATSFFSP